MGGSRLLTTPDIPSKIIDAGEVLQHISRIVYRGSALYFGNDGTNRYDDPGKSYGVLYLGFELRTALMESVFHKHQWHQRTRRTITRTEVGRRMVRAVGVVGDLHLADLTAPDVMASQFGLNLSQLASRRCIHTQRVSTTVHATVDAAGKSIFDGVLYPSRNNHPAACVALFNRTDAKVDLLADIDLDQHVDWPDFITNYQIVVLPK